MPAAVEWDPRGTVGELALSVARIAMEGMGYTKFEQLCATFNQKVEQENSDLEAQIQAVTRLLVAKTRRDLQPKSTADAQTAGLCLMWLANTRVGEWSLLQLYRWGESLPSGGD
jgi:hypothetical protein